MSKTTGLDVRPEKDGVSFHVHAAPRASKTKVVGVHDSALKVRLAAPPVDGEANAELVACLAKFFGVSKSAVTITGGHGSKRKKVRIDGLSAEDVEKRAQTVL